MWENYGGCAKTANLDGRQNSVNRMQTWQTESEILKVEPWQSCLLYLGLFFGSSAKFCILFKKYTSPQNILKYFMPPIYTLSEPFSNYFFLLLFIQVFLAKKICRQPLMDALTIWYWTGSNNSQPTLHIRA